MGRQLPKILDEPRKCIIHVCLFLLLRASIRQCHGFMYCYNTCQLYKLGIENSDTIDLVSSDTEPM